MHHPCHVTCGGTRPAGHFNIQCLVDLVFSSSTLSPDSSKMVRVTHVDPVVPVITHLAAGWLLARFWSFLLLLILILSKSAIITSLVPINQSETIKINTIINHKSIHLLLCIENANSLGITSIVFFYFIYFLKTLFVLCFEDTVKRIKLDQIFDYILRKIDI